MLGRAPRYPLFPYTTLFRSPAGSAVGTDDVSCTASSGTFNSSQVATANQVTATIALATCEELNVRSEEHTSELQSHSDLVCRLLLEKKKERSFLRISSLRMT